ncbi:MAG: hypothetical protein ACXWJM_03410 [Ramlibacter sp.]
MNAVSRLRVAAIVLALAASSAAHAVYRCGNVFQDTPCDAAGTQMTPGGVRPSQPAARGAAPAPAAAATTGASPFAAACSRLGEEAQKMVWKREGGATQERQMANLPAGNRQEMAKVLDSVYRKRGSAPEVRAAIEAECVAERQQAADQAAVLRALLPANGGQAGLAPAATAAPSAAAEGTAGESSTAAKPKAASGPNPVCVGWRRDLDSVNGQLRAGGNAASMERLQAQRRGIEKSLSDSHC